MKQRVARLHLGEAAVLSPTQAAAVYGGRRADLVRSWRKAGIIYEDPHGRERVVWGDVLRWSRGDLPKRRKSKGDDEDIAPLWKLPTS